MFTKPNLTKIKCIRSLGNKIRRKYLPWRNNEGDTDAYVVTKHRGISLIAGDW
jgi:hypothetical protein